MQSTVFWDITPCSPLSVNRRFGGTYRLHLEDRKNKLSKQPGWEQVYPRALSVGQTVRRRMVGLLKNNEWRGCRRKRSWSILRHCPKICVEELRKTMKKFIQDSPRYGRCPNRVPPEYNSEVLPPETASTLRRFELWYIQPVKTYLLFGYTVPKKTLLVFRTGDRYSMLLNFCLHLFTVSSGTSFSASSSHLNVCRRVAWNRLGIKRHQVRWKSIKVSEEYVPSIFRVEQ
jgi:hypothetical protein